MMVNGTPGVTRTRDLPVRNRLLFPAELREQISPIFTQSHPKSHPNLTQFWTILDTQRPENRVNPTPAYFSSTLGIHWRGRGNAVLMRGLEDFTKISPTNLTQPRFQTNLLTDNESLFTLGRNQQVEPQTTTIKGNAGMYDRITVSEAAKIKKVSRQAIHLAINYEHLKVEEIGPIKLVVCDKDFEAWEPNRKLQRALKRAHKKKKK